MKKILYIDLDGVCGNFAKAIFDLSPNTNVAFYTNEVDDICEANPTIFHTLEPIEGAIEAVKELFELFDVLFLSTPMSKVPLSYTGKCVWIQTHFGKSEDRRLVLTHRKDLAIGDIIVDDTTRNGVDKFKGIHIHFASEKFPDWKTTLTHLKTLA